MRDVISYNETVQTGEVERTLEVSETPGVCVIVQSSHGLKMRTNLTNLTNCDYQQIYKGGTFG